MKLTLLHGNALLLGLTLGTFAYLGCAQLVDPTVTGLTTTSETTSQTSTAGVPLTDQSGITPASDEAESTPSDALEYELPLVDPQPIHLPTDLEAEWLLRMIASLPSERAGGDSAAQ
ncbi:MAG: hypothetical protein HYV60_05790 [Planctomycetia bacterium]|nr:hypothetical protein [Planctomycetia bacterium]